MAIDYNQLGKRIAYYRGKKKFSQEKLAEMILVNGQHISNIENARKCPSLDMLLDLANILEVSINDLLVDSLQYSSSASNTEIYKLLLDCNETEERIILEIIKALKATLYSQVI